MTEAQAKRLADFIAGDARAAGRYDAHGLNKDDRGWYVCVSDALATDANPHGRQLDVRSLAGWDRIAKEG